MSAITGYNMPRSHINVITATLLLFITVYLGSLATLYRLASFDIPPLRLTAGYTLRLTVNSSRSVVQLPLANHSDWSLRRGHGHVLSWVGGWVGVIVFFFFFFSMSIIDDHRSLFVPPPVTRGAARACARRCAAAAAARGRSKV